MCTGNNMHPLSLQARTTCGLLTAPRPVLAESSDPSWPTSRSWAALGPTTSPSTRSPSTPWIASVCPGTATCPCPARSTGTHHATCTRRPTGRVRTEEPASASRTELGLVLNQVKVVWVVALSIACASSLSFYSKRKPCSRGIT